MSTSRAAWTGIASVVLLAIGVMLCSWAGVDAPDTSDAVILDRLGDGEKQAAAGIGLPLIGIGVALLVWFATTLRHVLVQLSGDDPLAAAIVPAAALVGGLMIVGVSLDVSSAITGFATDDFTATPDTARALGTAGLVVALTGLTGGGVLVAATTRIAHRAKVLRPWVVGVSYFVAALCLTSFWNGGMASGAFGLWLVGAVLGVRKAERSRADCRR